MARLPTALSVLALGALLAPAAADAKTTLTIKGAGFGHGVGMSQYGAYGFALKGAKYPDILAHYYTGTQLATLTNTPEVTVLLRSSKSATFTGATHIGDRPLDAGKSYTVKEQAGEVVLLSPTGRALVSFAGAVRASGGNSPLTLAGQGPNGVRDGRFRGALAFTPSGGTLLVINALDLDSYVRGVVAAESPSSWPQEALRAQAVAARTYAITTNAGGGRGFSQWADTRSQVYNGVSAETLTTDAAVAGTARQVVTYLGEPITTFFFSTSGGRTEDVENGFPGATPKPYLKSVEDPYDDTSPRHRWGPYRFSSTEVERRLSGLVKGRFRQIKVTKRGSSPRVVSAKVIGTRGTTVVSGPTLKARLGLFDTWATFTTIATKVTRSSARATPVRSSAQSGETGRSLRAATLSAASTRRPYRKLIKGHITGARDGQWVRIQRRTRVGWANAFWTTAVGQNGRYSATLPGPGTYRVAWRGQLGPDVRAR